MCEFVILSQDHELFAIQLKKLVNACGKYNKGLCDGVSRQCKTTNKTSKLVEVVIERDYVRKKIMSRVEYLLFYYKRSEITHRDEHCGFALCSTMNINGKKLLYIDLLCSANRKGAALLRETEKLAKKLKVHAIGLRAAVPKLLKYYRAKGFKRVFDPCQKNDRQQRRRLREWDQVAAKWSAVGWKSSGEGWWMSKCIV